MTLIRSHNLLSRNDGDDVNSSLTANDPISRIKSTEIDGLLEMIRLWIELHDFRQSMTK